MRTITESESTPKADGFFMPAEFAPQDRVWMGWPHRTDTWAHGAKPAQKQYAAIARAIAEFTPVTMCANQVDYAKGPYFKDGSTTPGDAASKPLAYPTHWMTKVNAKL